MKQFVFSLMMLLMVGTLFSCKKGGDDNADTVKPSVSISGLPEEVSVPTDVTIKLTFVDNSGNLKSGNLEIKSKSLAKNTDANPVAYMLAKSFSLSGSKVDEQVELDIPSNAKSGVYQVTATVVDDAGNQGSTTKDFTIK